VEGLEAEKITGVCNHPVLLACKILGGLVTFALRNRDKLARNDAGARRGGERRATTARRRGGGEDVYRYSSAAVDGDVWGCLGMQTVVEW